MGMTGKGRLGSMLAALLLAGCLAGCATPGPGAGDRTIWQARDQFVALVPQERESGAPAATNDHPVTIPPAELRRLLGAVSVLSGGAGSPVPLFTEAELQVLADEGSRGLGQAGADQEVTFAILGYHPALLGLAKEAKVTTGRLFFQEGRLNLILGVVQREVNDREDRRLSPFVPGSRLKPSPLAGRIVPATGGATYTLKRPDWLVFSAETGTPATAPPATEMRPATPETRPAKGVAERLQLLNELKEKKLITDEEYRAKRREILDEL